VSYSDLVLSDLVISGQVISDLAGEPTIVFATPIFDDKTQEILGVIMGHFDWNVVIQLLETFNHKGLVHLFNQQGLVIATKGNHKDRILKHSFPGDLKNLEKKIFTIDIKQREEDLQGQGKQLRSLNKELEKHRNNLAVKFKPDGGNVRVQARINDCRLNEDYPLDIEALEKKLGSQQLLFANNQSSTPNIQSSIVNV